MSRLDWDKARRRDAVIQRGGDRVETEGRAGVPIKSKAIQKEALQALVLLAADIRGSRYTLARQRHRALGRLLKELEERQGSTKR